MQHCTAKSSLSLISLPSFVPVIPKGEFAHLATSRVEIYFTLEIDWDKIGENEEDMYEGNVDLVRFIDDTSTRYFLEWLK